MRARLDDMVTRKRKDFKVLARAHVDILSRAPYESTLPSINQLFPVHRLFRAGLTVLPRSVFAELEIHMDLYCVHYSFDKLTCPASLMYWPVLQYSTEKTSVDDQGLSLRPLS